MIYNIFPKKDSTIYERYPETNTGLDSILEISKILIQSESNTYALNSRILMQFDYSDLHPLVEAGFNTGSTDGKTDKYFLKLYTVEQRNLSNTFTLQVNAISGSWEMGLGKYDYSPRINEGVSWLYKDGSTVGTKWLTSSFAPNSTGSYSLIPGGCNWYTGSTVTKTIEYNESTDLEFNVTPLVYLYTNSGSSNNGFIIKRSDADEKSVGDAINLQYFSSDTNTIYLPFIRVNWDDAIFNTGSLSGINTSTENVIYFKNLHDQYTVNDRVTFRLSGRPKYPRKSFSTSSVYSEEYFLPYSSSYSIEDINTKETVIPHDYTYTRISCDPTGSFFNVWMDGLQPERWYKFTIRTKFSNNNVQIHDNGYIFKINRVV